jgi:hypothetical protein
MGCPVLPNVLVATGRAGAKPHQQQRCLNWFRLQPLQPCNQHTRSPWLWGAGWHVFNISEDLEDAIYKCITGQGRHGSKWRHWQGCSGWPIRTELSCCRGSVGRPAGRQADSLYHQPSPKGEAQGAMGGRQPLHLRCTPSQNATPKQGIKGRVGALG